MKRYKSELKVLKAFNGDCVLIKTFDNENNEFVILIDGGTSATFKKSLKKELEHISEIDLLVLTHIDDDHIKGLLKFFDSSFFDKIEIKKYMFNGGNLVKIRQGSEISYGQGLEFEKHLLKKEGIKKWEGKTVFTEKPTKLAKGINCKILSPDNKGLENLFSNWETIKDKETASTQVAGERPDKAKDFDVSLCKLAKREYKPSKSLRRDIFNNSSIAFILETPDFKGLFLGDARPETIIDSLGTFSYSKNKQLEVDFVKTSHHGSKNNISNELMELIKSNEFIISTNGGHGRAKHPDREAIARIVAHPKRKEDDKQINIYFNYPQEDIEKKTGMLLNEGEEEKDKFLCIFDKNIIPLK